MRGRSPSIALRAFTASARGAYGENAEHAFVRTEHGTFAIARGAGGAEPGEYAAMTVLDAFLAAARSGEPLASAIARAGNEIYLESSGSRAMRGACATFTGVVVAANEATVVHVGDSRLYRLRGGTLEQLTTDTRRPEALVTYGRRHERPELVTTRENASTHIGLGPDFHVETRAVTLVTRDILVLCSPGVWEHLPNDVIVGALVDPPSDEAARELVGRAFRASGGEVNASAIVIEAPATPLLPSS